MKTHELAAQLSLLGKSLRQLPNIEIGEMSESFFPSNLSKTNFRKISESEIPAALNALVALNDVSKQQWQDLISNYNFEIEIRPRDAKRDIVGKLLNYLADNKMARESLSNTGKKRNSGVSSELESALNLLLK